MLQQCVCVRAHTPQRSTVLSRSRLWEQVTFPTSVVAADSWWRYDPTLDVMGDEYQVSLSL